MAGNGDVYTGGDFTTVAAGLPASGVAKWNGTAWNSLGTGLNGSVYALAVGPSDQLNAGGDFTTVGDASKVTAYFAVYDATAPLATAPALRAGQVGLYPNPARGRFIVAVPGVSGATSVQAELRNALGQVVGTYAAALPAIGAQLTLSTGALVPGVYTLRLRAGTTTVTKRVTVE